MPDEKAREILGRYEFLKKQRDNWIDEWMDIRDYILPRTGMFEEAGDAPNDGASRYDFLVDATATRAMRVLAAGMQGGLTSPARPWFRLSLYDDQLTEFRPVQEWLHTVEKILYGRFARSNFYNAIHKVYSDEAGYGTAVLFCEEDPDDMIRFVVLSPGEYCIAENSRNMVDTVHRILWMTIKQMAEKFGKNNLPDTIKRELNKESLDPYEYRKVLHAVEYRDIYDPKKIDKKNKPVRSVYIDFDLSEILEEGGYNEWPVACPRWVISGSDTYGRSPGHDVLPDVKMLQEMQSDKLAALQKMVEPPLKSGGSLKSEVSHLAGGVTFMDNATQTSSLEPIYQINPDMQGMMLAIEDVRTQIREGLYNDLFLMLVNAPQSTMTATEVMERHEEKLLMLGPVIERQFYELLNPVIDRTFSILMREGKIPPPPQELIEEAKRQGDDKMDLKVEFISLLAQAQKIVATRAIDAVTTYALNVAQVKPDVLDKLDVDQAMDEYASATGAPPNIIVPDDMVRKAREVKVQQLAQAQQQQQMAQGAQTMKTISEVNMEEGSALNQLQNSMDSIPR
jgi:hypothetical protein